MRTCLFARGLSSIVLAAGLAGCSSNPVQWSSVAPYAPNTLATAVGVTVDGRPARFALSGSHLAMYQLMPTCPQLEIP